MWGNVSVCRRMPLEVLGQLLEVSSFFHRMGSRIKLQSSGLVADTTHWAFLTCVCACVRTYKYTHTHHIHPGPLKEQPVSHLSSSHFVLLNIFQLHLFPWYLNARMHTSHIEVRRQPAAISCLLPARGKCLLHLLSLPLVCTNQDLIYLGLFSNWLCSWERLEVMISLLPPPECWNDRQATGPTYTILRIHLSFLIAKQAPIELYHVVLCHPTPCKQKHCGYWGWKLLVSGGRKEHAILSVTTAMSCYLLRTPKCLGATLLCLHPFFLLNLGPSFKFCHSGGNWIAHCKVGR